MTEQELSEIEKRVNMAFRENLKNASGPSSMLLDWKDTTILSLIAEVRRLNAEMEKANKAIEMLGGHPLTFPDNPIHAIHAIMRKMRCSYHLAEYFYSKGHRA